MNGNRWLSNSRTLETVLAGSLLAVSWLIPNHQLPWTAFHHELVVAIALGVMLALLGWQGRQGLRIPLFGAVLLLLAAVPWLQFAAGLLPKAGTAFISSAYIAALALAVTMGFSARSSAAERLMEILSAALIIAALANLPIQLAQWFQWYSTDITSIESILVTPIGGGRPSGSILQPNLLATLQVWALLSLTWWRVVRGLSTGCFALVFLLLTFGLGLTQSRAGLLEMAMCTAFIYLVARRWAGGKVCTVWLSMLIFLVIWSLNFQAVADWLGVKGAAEGRLSAIDGARIDAWHAFGLAVLDSPWWGYGISDVSYAYFLNAESHPQIYIGQRFGHAHNLLLDMALWVGIPLTIVLTLVTAVWGWRRFLDARQNPSLLIPVLMIMALTVHAMLELPHQYLYMLIPAGLCIGMLCAATGAPSVLELGRPAAIIAASIVWAAAAITAWDYFPYQERYTEWRFDNLNVGYRLGREIKPPLVLDQLHDELVLYRTDYSKPLSPERLDWLDATTKTVTTGPAIYYTAKAFVMAGRIEDALVWMKRFNAVTPPDLVEETRQIWARDRIKNPALHALDWPTYAGRVSTFRFETEPATIR